MAHYWLPDATSGSGTGNWSATGATGHWADDAGGTNLGKAAPTSSDDVYFGAAAFNGAGQVVTVDAQAYCKDMDWTGATNSPTLTSATSAQLRIYGNSTFISAMAIGGNLTIRFYSTGTQTLTTGGVTFANSGGLIWQGSGGTVSLQDDLNTSVSIDIRLGNLTTNNFNIISSADFTKTDTGTFGASTITLGSSTITCRDWVYSGTNLTMTANTATINISRNCTNTNSLDFNGATVNLTGATSTVTGSNTSSTLALPSGTTQTITLTAGTKQTCTTANLSGDATHQHIIQSSVAGKLAYIQAGTFDANYVTFVDVLVNSYGRRRGGGFKGFRFG